MMYHSALKKKTSDLVTNPKKLFSVTFPERESIAFWHDIKNGYHFQYLKCDFIYAEIAWRTGIKAFNDRAESSTEYDAYIEGIRKFIRGAKENMQPVMILTGKKECKDLNPESLTSGILHKEPCMIAGWNIDVNQFEGMNNEECLNKIVKMGYRGIGDFTCGYGLTMEYAFQNNMRCIASDYNAKCIGVISERFRNEFQIQKAW